ncbi:hypothetical protein E4U21_007000 [Claviceps maximensis]|nr:hypothetical protein E4U21_007000 [Claviceps maximensis]
MKLSTILGGVAVLALEAAGSPLGSDGLVERNDEYCCIGFKAPSLTRNFYAKKGVGKVDLAVGNCHVTATRARASDCGDWHFEPQYPGCSGIGLPVQVHMQSVVSCLIQ